MLDIDAPIHTAMDHKYRLRMQRTMFDRLCEESQAQCGKHQAAMVRELINAFNERRIRIIDDNGHYASYPDLYIKR